MAVFLRRVCSVCPPFVPRPPCLAMPQGCCRLRCSANEPRLRAPDGEVCASPAGSVCASVCSFGPGGHCATRRVELAWKVGTTRVEQERAWRGRRGVEGEEEGYAAEAERGSGSL